MEKGEEGEEGEETTSVAWRDCNVTDAVVRGT